MMKNLSNMSVEELSQEEQEHLIKLATETHNRNQLIIAASRAKAFELDSRLATQSEVINFINHLTNFLPASTMKQISHLLFPVDVKVKLTPAVFANILKIISAQKLAHDSEIAKLTEELKNLQTELNFRVNMALKLQERELEIDAKKPFSFKLRFWVLLRKIVDKLSHNKPGILSIKVEKVITKLLPTIQIPVVKLEETSIESLSGSSEIDVESKPNRRDQLNVLKALQMPKKSNSTVGVANDDETAASVENSVELDGVSDNDSNNKNSSDDGLGLWEASKVGLSPVKANALSKAVNFFKKDSARSDAKHESKKDSWNLEIPPVVL